MESAGNAEKKVWIPEVPRERIVELAKRIRPVVRHLWGPWYIAEVDLFEVAYAWDPLPVEKADNLWPLGDVITYHRYGHPAFFKPSIAEVLAQIPAEFLDHAIAFEIVEWPQSAEDFCRKPEAFNAGYHAAKTRIYSIGLGA